ncbi:uncharacterized protein [Rutidosis leptorrhynchoides]|uniref:uncharacterized protein n=1 Tax=Rutidosis leptorrhynchoides TaxID=125765 RepID=UPI003A996D40
MKIVSYNLRGFCSGKECKVGDVKKLIRSEKPSFLALKETKKHLVNFQWIQSLWGSTECDFIQQEMIGKSGGQLLIWDKKMFEATDVIKIDRVVGKRGVLKNNGLILIVLNIYGPHEDSKKETLWDSLSNLLSRKDDEIWVLGGDFNEVRNQDERLNCEFIEYRARRFNSFIKKAIAVWDNLSAIALERTKSDHCPIVLKDEEKNFGPKPFRFFDAWLDVDGIDQVVIDKWVNSCIAANRLDCKFLNKLKEVKEALKSWSKSSFGQLDGEIDTLKSLAHSLELKAETGLLDSTEAVLWKDTRKKWFEKENIKISMLRKKARVRWAVEGDENTKFFHSIIRHNYSRSNIHGLTLNGSWNDNPQAIKEAALSHFKARFQESDVIRPSLEDLSYPSISLDDAANLECKFTEKEILEAINECGSTKDPGPDGFNMRFFKKYWENIKSELVDAISWFWEKGEISRGCNASFVTLVPKKNDPLCLNDYRPISLIGSYYKIVAKLISNRLRKVLLGLIGPEQSAFLKGRFILDGALIVNETIDYLKANKKKGFILKADFEKAFDSLNWNFLMDVMKSMGFGKRWRDWILACLKSESISILVNGSPTPEFRLERGVRQGDPLSPFLFILAAEGLNILTKAAIDKGVEVSEINPLASHIGCQVGNFPFIYLGLPIGAKMNSLKDWGTVVDKFNSRLSGWKMRSMSFGGRLVLIKSVLSSLPLYYFSIFRASSCVIKVLERVRRSFFWGGSGSGSKMSWWWWRFKTETDSLWTKVIRSIHGASGGLLSDNDLPPKYGVWNNIILAGKNLEDLQVGFKDSFEKSVGNGGNTLFWKELWVGNDKLCNLFPRLFKLEIYPDATVNDRMVVNGLEQLNFSWKRELSGRVLTEFEGLQQILSTAALVLNKEDQLSCPFAPQGVFSVSKLSMASDDKLLDEFSAGQKIILNKLVPKKLEIFVWRAVKKKLPVRVELDKCGIDLHSTWCPLCDDSLESVDHSLIFCKHAMEVWDRVFKWWNMGSFNNFSLSELLLEHNQSLHSISSIGRSIWLAIKWIGAYLIWKNRNNKVFCDKNWIPRVALNEIQTISFDWISNRLKGRKIDWQTWMSNPVAYLNLL